jgi:hypothetical protein
MEKTEHQRLLALFALAIVNHLPLELARRIAAQLDELGCMSLRDGDTTVGTAARELATLLADSTAMRKDQ